MRSASGKWTLAMGVAVAIGGCAGGAVEAPVDEPASQAEASSGDEELSCEAGVLETEQGQQVVAIASEEHQFLILLPVAEDWRVDCTGSETVVEAGSETLAMHLYLHRVTDVEGFDERGMLEQLADKARQQAEAQGGVRFVQGDVVEVEGHLVHESLVEAEADAGTAHAWSYLTVREGSDGSVLMLNYMWTTMEGSSAEQDVLRMRDLMQAIGGAFDILPQAEPA
jgi:hypothetical protein